MIIKFCYVLLSTINTDPTRHECPVTSGITDYSINLTPCSKGLSAKLTDLQPVQKFPAFYGTPRSITAFTYSIKINKTTYWDISVFCSNINFSLQTVL